MDTLQKKHDRENEVMEATFEAEEAEYNAEIAKALNDEHKDNLRHAHRGLLEEVGGFKL